MSDSSQNPKNPILPNKMIDLLVSDIFKKNKINIDEVKKNISNEQKERLRELVQDLSQQVENFVNSSENNTELAEDNEEPTKKGKRIRFKKEI